ncbi:MAG TPA: hypothetical protein ENG66_00795 [Thermococcus sp.]|nr:hypothetical protein [Thermococcus sp.]
MRIGLENLNEIFHALDRQIEVHGGVPISLVVCGGTALAALGLVSRTTKDVDVLAQAEEAEEGIKVLKINEFPQWLKEAAKTVGRDFGLPEGWLNLGPASQLESGLPDGFEKRLVKRRYGKFLTVYFIGRTDQIFFKLYAAVDRNDYHVQDLFALKPTEKEMEEATKWVLTQDVSEGFRLIVKDFLIKYGYADIAKRI